MLEQPNSASIDESTQDPHTYQDERQKILEILGEEKEKKRISFAQSEHFIVAYAGNLNLGTWLDSDPNALATFLEQQLAHASSKFGIDVKSDEFHVVRVKNGRIEERGIHTRGHEKFYHRKRHMHALFSGVSQIKAVRNQSGMPNFYSVATHEAIGHGFLMYKVFPQWDISHIVRPTIRSSTEEINAFTQILHETRRIGFLTEGLAGNVQFEAEALNPHDYFALELVRAVMTSFRKLGGKWKIDDFNNPLFTQLVHKKGFSASFSVAGAFDLARAAKSSLLSEKLDPSECERGASFIEFMLETFGKETFLGWAKNVNPGNFIPSLEECTNMDQHNLESLWMQCVFSRVSFDNPLILKVQRTPDTRPSTFLYDQEDLHTVEEIYKTFL